ncbi:hypothetical protein EDC04DRAFT_2604151 [Pisolithus marmoratus]|nr:hypothetical protein EDC04DRAFT_2604151 [Pisolithus marmoratus]
MQQGKKSPSESMDDSGHKYTTTGMVKIVIGAVIDMQCESDLLHPLGQQVPAEMGGVGEGKMSYQTTIWVTLHMVRRIKSYAKGYWRSNSIKVERRTQREASDDWEGGVRRRQIPQDLTCNLLVDSHPCHMGESGGDDNVERPICTQCQAKWRATSEVQLDGHLCPTGGVVQNLLLQDIKSPGKWRGEVETGENSVSYQLKGQGRGLVEGGICHQGWKPPQRPEKRNHCAVTGMPHGK